VRLSIRTPGRTGPQGGNGELMSTFQEIDIEAQDEYLSRFRKCQQKCSDYSFVNLWSWRQIYGLTLLFDSTLVWLKQTRMETVYWAPVGDWDAVDWSTAVSVLERPARLTRVPQRLMEILRGALGEGVVVSEARNHWDYVYSVQELIDLKGERFHKKKVLLDRFLRENEYEYLPLNEDTLEQAVDLQSEWCAWRDCEHSSALLAENGAILNTFLDWKRLNGIFGGGLTVSGKMVAYTVGERLDDETLLIHYEKAAPDPPGSYQAINNIFLRKEGRGFRDVNREQDLGEEGLRKAKLSYYPRHFLRKYDLLIK
jgi:uncharacterized protein